MQTRMEKYTDAHEEVGLRFKKNEDLYKTISEEELNNYNVKTNATVIDNNGTNIDVEHIKRILETRYNSAPKRKSIVVPEDEQTQNLDVIETKEYDINLILQKAKEQENSDYDKNRFKKLRDTQYDILKDLNLSEPKKNEKEDDKPVEKDELMNLINTITQKELENREKNSSDPLDLFPDLKGNDDTVILEGMKDELNEYFSSNEITLSEEIKNEVKDDVKEQSEITDNSLDNSFYTTSTVFTQSDFDDFEDLKNEVKGNKILLIIVTVLIIAGLLVGIFLLLNNFLGINFFKR